MVIGANHDQGEPDHSFEEKKNPGDQQHDSRQGPDIFPIGEADQEFNGFGFRLRIFEKMKKYVPAGNDQKTGHTPPQGHFHNAHSAAVSEFILK